MGGGGWEGVWAEEISNNNMIVPTCNCMDGKLNETRTY